MDPIAEFLKCMTREVQNCQGVIRDNFNKPLKMSEDDEINCHVCEKKNINLMMNLLEITVMLLVNIEVLLITNAI